jgi:phage-related minor tail protein
MQNGARVMPDPTQSPTMAVAADTEALKRSLEETARIGDQFAARLTSAFEQVAVKGRGLDDVVRSLALSLSNLALGAALKPLQSGLGSIFDKLFAGLAVGAPASLPTPFAQGGVIASPVQFPMSGGQGLAGERGAEAIMPLARGPDGRLGVAMSGGAQPVTVNFTVSSPDATGFKQSETQIAAMLQRALARGQRNL